MSSPLSTVLYVMMRTKPARTVERLVTASTIAHRNRTSLLASSVASVDRPDIWLVIVLSVRPDRRGATTAATETVLRAGLAAVRTILTASSTRWEAATAADLLEPSNTTATAAAMAAMTALLSLGSSVPLVLLPHGLVATTVTMTVAKTLLHRGLAVEALDKTRMARVAMALHLGHPEVMLPTATATATTNTLPLALLLALPLALPLVLLLLA